MPLLDFIRRFFGFPNSENFNRHNGFKKPTVIGDNEDDDDDELDEDIVILDDYRNRSPVFNVFSGNMEDMNRYFQQQLDEIFKTFNSPWFGDTSRDFFGNGDKDITVRTLPPEANEDVNPRSKFLKPSVEPRKDSNIQTEEDCSHDMPLVIPHHDNSGFGFFSSNPLDIHKFFEQQFDDIMKKFSSSGWFSFDEGNSFEIPNDENPGRIEEFIHPRNRFLKPSYEQPQNFKPDSDIDNKAFAPKVFGNLLDKEPVQSQSAPCVSRSIVTSRSRKILPNGGIEERSRCMRDGKEEVTVSRQLGDMKHIITTIKLPDGTTTKNEEFINFNESQLRDFNKSWNKL